MLTQKRIYRLDVLRGVAILLVLGRHMPSSFLSLPDCLLPVFVMWQRIGWTGVDLFFVLSGFLVSGLLFQEYREHGSIRLVRFFLRRGFRIYPSFYFMLGVTVFFLAYQLTFDRVLIEVFFLQSYFNQRAVWAHTWSLAVEEHFYLFIGLLLLLLSKRRGPDPFRLMPFIMLAVGLLCPWGRFLVPYKISPPFVPSHLRLDSLLFGTLLSYGHHFHRQRLESFVRSHRRLIGYASAGLIAPCFFLEIEMVPFISQFGLTFLYLGYGGFLLLMLYSDPLGKPQAWESVIAAIGVRSYTMYLWHVPILNIVKHPLRALIGGPLPFAAEFFIYSAGSMAMGFYLYNALEQPVLRWRDRRFPSLA